MSFTKKSLAIELSKLKSFINPKVSLEQYPTESDIAADVIWCAAMNNEIQNKTVADLGAGTGILGLGCLLMGAKEVVLVEKDEDALRIAKDNYKTLFEKYDLKYLKIEFLHCDINDFLLVKKGNDFKVDVVIQNPPFGIKDAHADKTFLDVAFKTSPLIYSLHKAETKSFIEKFSKDNGFKVIEIRDYDFPLKQTMKYHTKKIQRINVGCFKIKKN